MGSRQPEEAEVLDLTRFSTEFNGESDRGAVLVAASRLDEVLKGILLAYLRDTKSASDLLDGFNAPLGTFSARAAACHAMGLIDDTEFSDISRIRKIRNTFGHHWKDIDFGSPRGGGCRARLAVARSHGGRGHRDGARAIQRCGDAAAHRSSVARALGEEGKTESEGVAEHHEFAASTRMNPLQRFDFSSR